jgi:hypothetical protein
MIVRQASGLLQLISQPDHAALARRIMEQWQPLLDAPRRDAVLLAAGEHDNGWREVDANPSVDSVSGRIFDFVTVPIEARQAVWPRGIGRLAQRDTWAAALVAHHALFVYDGYRGDRSWSAFFAEMEVLRTGLIGASGRSESELTSDYRFVRIGDLISLIFCNRIAEPQVYDGWTFRLVDDRVVVTPDGLGGGALPIAIAARELADVRYRSDAELRAAVLTAPFITLRGSVSASTASQLTIGG